MRVGVAWLRHTCGACRFCTSGRENLCELSRYTGFHAHGGFAEYAVVPEDFAYELPESFDDMTAAPLLCAGIIGYRALLRCNLRRNEPLGLFGFGSSAQVVLQLWGPRGAGPRRLGSPAASTRRSCSRRRAPSCPRRWRRWSAGAGSRWREFT
jgi:propanol-preferring alcohol dehydrogenase